MLWGAGGATNSLYDDPALYDILHARGTAGEARGLLRLARRHARRPDGLWLEPACGTGRLLRAAAARGRRVAGFDRNPGLIAYARALFERRGLSARLFVADMESFGGHVKPGSAAFAFNLGNTIRHLPGDRAVLSHLEEMRRALRRDGVYAVGLSLARYGREDVTEDFWSGSRGRCRVDQLVQYLPPLSGRREEILHHVTVTRPRGAEHFDFRDDLRAYDRGEWDALLRKSAFRLRAVVDSEGDPIDPGVFDYAIHVLEPR